MTAPSGALPDPEDSSLATAHDAALCWVLFDLSPDPVVIHDGRRVLEINPAAAQALGFDRAEDAIGCKVVDFIHPEDRLAAARRVAAMLGKAEYEPSLSERFIRRDGVEIQGDVAARAIVYRGMPAVLLMVRDVTDRVLAEDKAEHYRLELEELVAQRTAELAEVRTELDAIVAVVMRTVELRDPYTAGHQERVALLSAAMADQLGLSAEDREHLGVAARLHDIGKVTIPAEILAKPGVLGKVEYDLMKGHAQATADILLSVKLDWPLAAIVRQHHERLDGSGYPEGLAGDDILPMARVLAVADVVEAMISHRPYRPAVGLEAALAEIGQGRGSLYDCDAVDACLRAFEAGFTLDN
jgi:PAS domain S-box-containing protein/putative nucleotidyltransferase with HDIG domain